jgi:hypothetical protein
MYLELLRWARRRQTELARQNERLLGGVKTGEIFLTARFFAVKEMENHGI